MTLGLSFAVATASAARPQTDATLPSGHTVVLSLESRVFQNERAIRVHLPIGYDEPANATRRYPVLYMNDGFAVFSPKSWDAPKIVDDLTRRGAIVPLILVGIDNAASIAGSQNPGRDRTNEFLPYPDPLEPDIPAPQGTKYPDFVVKEVMPLVEQRFRTSTNASETLVGGASYGGIAALYTLLQYPARFSGLLLESTPTFLFGGRLVTESAELAPMPERVYVGIGTRESDDETVLSAAAKAPHLAEVLPTLVLVNRVAGATHSSAAWRARLPTALRFLFAPVK